MTPHDFEDEVATLFRLSGYEVTRLAKRNKTQGIDFVVQVKTPIHTVSMGVECKRTSRPLGAIEIKQLINGLGDLRQEFDRLLIVSENGFSKRALNMAQSHRIDCLTLPELKNVALGLQEFLENLANSFDSSTLPAKYIELWSAENDSNKSRTLVSEALNKWRDKSESKCCFLIGAEGAGKSLACRKFASESAKAYKTNVKGARVPILIQPRQFKGEEPLLHTLSETARRLSGRTWSRYHVDYLIRQNNLLLIFDGLDELEPSERRPFIEEIGQFVIRNNVKILISCRTNTYNTNLDNLPSLLAATKVMTLQPLDDMQVDTWLASLANAKNETLIKVLRLPEAFELVRHPFFLPIISKIAENFSNQENISITGLYQTYVDAALGRNGEAATRAVTHRMILRNLALRSTLSGITKLSIRDAKKYIKGSIEDIPLVHIALGEIRFEHKSLVDFFTAEKIVEFLDRSHSKWLSLIILPGAVLQFLAGLLPPLDTLRKFRRGATSKILIENVDNILQLCQIDFAKRLPILRLKRLELRGIKCFDHLVLDLNSETGAILLGENGVGKTTVLQAIVLCALGAELASKLLTVPERLLRGSAVKGVLCATFLVTGLNSDVENEVIIGLEVNRGSRNFQLIKEGKYACSNAKDFLNARALVGATGLFVAAYGSGRNLFLEDPSSSLREDPLLDRVASLFDPRKLLIDARRLARLIIGDGGPFREHECPTVLNVHTRNALVKTFTMLLPEDRDFGEEGEYRSRFGNTQLADLSDGFRSTLAWAGHLLVHLLSSIKWVGDVSDISGILLIDEVDLHLHPQWQRVVLEKIRAAFPKLQLITTTHSPLVLSDAEGGESNTFLLECDKDSVKVNSSVPHVQGWRIDQILASELFGYIVDRDPTTERVLREASILAGKGRKRTDEEEQRYSTIVKIIKDALISDGQTCFERDIELECRRAIINNVHRLESELFGTKR